MPGRPDFERRGVSLPLQVSDRYTGKPVIVSKGAINDAPVEPLIRRSIVEPFDVIQARAITTDPFIVWTYTVPIHQVLAISAIAIAVNNPAYGMTNMIGWRLLFNGKQPPNISATYGGFSSSLFTQSTGDLYHPMEIEEILAPAGALVQVQADMYTTVAFMQNSAIIMGARIKGKLLTPVVQ